MLLLIASGTANAVSLTSVATSFTGDPLDVLLTFDETAEGDILVTAEVIGGMEGDIRAIFLNIADDALLADLEITDDLVTGVNTSGSVDDMRRSANLRGGGSPCPCDLGVAFGSPGIGKDDLQIVSSLLSHPDADLDLSLVAGQLAGVRVTSVGDGGGPRRVEQDSGPGARARHGHPGALRPVGTRLVPFPAKADRCLSRWRLRAPMKHVLLFGHPDVAAALARR
jgi:hypothetical protein